MELLPLAPVRFAARQRGVAAVEFALVAIPFFLLLLGAIEFGRLMYLWNTVQEVTRNAARQAVVTNFTPGPGGGDNAEIARIKREAVFGIYDAAQTTPYFLPVSSEVNNNRVILRYLNAQEGVATPMPSSPGENITRCVSNANDPGCIRYVEACVSTGTTCAEAILFVPLIGLFAPLTSGLTIPLSTVRMPAESLGYQPAS